MIEPSCETLFIPKSKLFEEKYDFESDKEDYIVGEEEETLLFENEVFKVALL